MAASAALDSAAPMKPDRHADHRGRAGGRRPSSSSSRRNSAVGALPIATTAPSSRSPQRSTAAAERVVPSALRQRRDAGVVQRADDLVAGRQPGAGDAAGDHLRVTEHRRTGVQRRAGPGDDGRRSTPTSATRSTMPQAWIMRTTTADDVGREAREVGLGPDGGERAAVDLGALAYVVTHSDGSRARCDTRPRWRSGRRRWPPAARSGGSHPLHRTRCPGASADGVPSAAAAARASAWTSASAFAHPGRPAHALTPVPGRGGVDRQTGRRGGAAHGRITDRVDVEQGDAAPRGDAQPARPGRAGQRTESVVAPAGRGARATTRARPPSSGSTGPTGPAPRTTARPAVRRADRRPRAGRRRPSGRSTDPPELVAAPGVR